jgi:hypothetical protein
MQEVGRKYVNFKKVGGEYTEPGPPTDNKIENI